jgi:N-acetylmuramoyl-L-alanine amidase
MDITIKNHMIHVDGKRVPYRRSPNGGQIIKVTDQVLHHTASGITPGGDISWLTNRNAGASAHTVIARDGSITQLMPLNRRAWHAGRSRYKGRSGCNGFTIGHEIDNPGHLSKRADGRFDGVGGPYEAADVIDMPSAEHGGHRYWLKFTEAQIATVLALVVAIHHKYDLRSVTTHYHISPGRKTDPGPHFPYARLNSMIEGRGDYELPVDEDGNEVDAFVDASPFLNVRRWPSANSEKVGELPHKTGIQIIRSGTFDHTGPSATWHMIRKGDLQGWVHGAYVDIV